MRPGSHELGAGESWFRSFQQSKAKKGQQPAGRWGLGAWGWPGGLLSYRDFPALPLWKPRGLIGFGAARPLPFRGASSITGQPAAAALGPAEEPAQVCLPRCAGPGARQGWGAPGPGARRGPDTHTPAALRGRPQAARGAPRPTPQTPRWQERPGRAGTRPCAVS